MKHLEGERRLMHKKEKQNPIYNVRSQNCLKASPWWNECNIVPCIEQSGDSSCILSSTQLNTNLEVSSGANAAFGTLRDIFDLRVKKDFWGNLHSEKATTCNMWVKTFTSYRDLDLKSCSAAELAPVLDRFYADLKKDRSVYKRNRCGQSGCSAMAPFWFGLQNQHQHWWSLQES